MGVVAIRKLPALGPSIAFGKFCLAEARFDRSS